MAEHLRGIAACTHDLRALYSIPVLLRAQLEVAARTAYQLDPTISDRERVRRWLNDRLNSLVEQVNVAHGTGLPSSAAFADRKLTTIRSYLVSAANHGFTVHDDALKVKSDGVIRTFPYLDTPRPKAQTVMERMPELQEAARTLHRLTSAVVHGDDHGMYAFFNYDRASDGDLGMSNIPIGTSPARLIDGSSRPPSWPLLGYSPHCAPPWASILVCGPSQRCSSGITGSNGSAKNATQRRFQATEASRWPRIVTTPGTGPTRS